MDTAHAHGLTVLLNLVHCQLSPHECRHSEELNVLRQHDSGILKAGRNRVHGRNRLLQAKSLCHSRLQPNPAPAPPLAPRHAGSKGWQARLHSLRICNLHLKLDVCM